MATTSMSVRLDSLIARSTLRPMRPNPLIATLTCIKSSMLPTAARCCRGSASRGVAASTAAWIGIVNMRRVAIECQRRTAARAVAAPAALSMLAVAGADRLVAREGSAAGWRRSTTAGSRRWHRAAQPRRGASLHPLPHALAQQGYKRQTDGRGHGAKPAKRSAGGGGERDALKERARERSSAGARRAQGSLEAARDRITALEEPQQIANRIDWVIEVAAGAG